MKCMECDNSLSNDAPNLIVLGWRYIQLVADEFGPGSGCSGWRCPRCIARWDARFDCIGMTEQ